MDDTDIKTNNFHKGKSQSTQTDIYGFSSNERSDLKTKITQLSDELKNYEQVNEQERIKYVLLVKERLPDVVNLSVPMLALAIYMYSEDPTNHRQKELLESDTVTRHIKENIRNANDVLAYKSRLVAYYSLVVKTFAVNAF